MIDVASQAARMPDAASTQDPPSPPLVPPLWLIIAISGLPQVSVNILMPSLPGLVDHFATDIATIYYALSLYLVGLAVGQLAYGPLSDRYGRRPLLLTGIVIYCIGCLVCMLAPDLVTFLGGRVLQALGGCAGLVLGRAMICDVYAGGRAASMIGYTVMGMVVLTGIAPTLGGMLDEVGTWRAVFGFLTVMGALVGLAAWLRAAETASGDSASPSLAELLRAYRVLVTRRVYLRLTLYSSLVFASFFAVVAGSPMLVIGEWGHSPAAFGAWWLIGSASYFVGNFLAGRLSQRLGVERMLGIGTPIMLLGSVLLVGPLAIGWHHPSWVFMPTALTFLGSGMVQPNAISGAIEGHQGIGGAAAGILGSMQIAFAVISISLVGALQADTPIIFAVIAGGAVAAAAIVNWALR